MDSSVRLSSECEGGNGDGEPSDASSAGGPKKRHEYTQNVGLRCGSSPQRKDSLEAASCTAISAGKSPEATFLRSFRDVATTALPQALAHGTAQPQNKTAPTIQPAAAKAALDKQSNGPRHVWKNYLDDLLLIIVVGEPEAYWLKAIQNPQGKNSGR